MGSRGRAKRAAGGPAPRSATEPMLSAGHLGQLMWLHVRHLRTELAWWGYAFGTDLAERVDLMERIYQLYLVLIVGGSAFAAWSMLLARVEESFRLLGPVLVPLSSFLLAGAPVALSASRALAGLRSSPLKLTAPDAGHIASGTFTGPELALTSAVGPALGWGSALALAAFAAGSGLAAAGTGLDAGAAAALDGLAGAVAAVAADVVGYLGLRVPRRRRALRVGLGSAVVAVSLGALALAAFAVFGGGMWHLAPPADLAAISSFAPALTGGLAVLLIGSIGILALVARRADLIRAIEESGAFATLHGVRHLALTAPTVYRDLRRRYRMARRRPLRLVPAIGEGWAAPVSRSAVTHLRRWRDASRLLTVGLVLAPLGSVALTGGPHPVTLLVWGLLCIVSHGAVAELAGAFREDMRVRLVRDALPFSTRSLALLDGLVPTGVAVALFMLYLAAGAITVPGAVSAPAVGCGLLLIVCFSLAATLDAIEVPAARRRPSTAAGVLGTAVAAGVLSLAGPEAACLALLIAAAIMFGMLGKAA
ncbi:MAG: hypothetical protein SOY67_01535 [Collinsella sp.]|nr:hypothetical protein [Collinsella sp.]